MMLREFAALVNDLERLSDTDLPVYFENGSEISGIAFIERPNIASAEDPSIMIY